MDEKKIEQVDSGNQSEEKAIDTAIDEAVTTSLSGANGTDVAENKPKEEDVEDGGEEGRATTSEPSYKPDDETIERAVRAGMSLEDVMKMPSKDVTERMVDMAERAQKAEKPKEDFTNGPQDDAAEDPDDEMGKAIRDMENDRDADGNSNYDPNIIKILKGLYEENRKLKSAGASAEKASFFDKQFGSLDEGVRSHVDAPHKSQLKAKFDMLMAGYKATKANVSQEDVFQEAAKLALGDLMTKAAEERKTAALEERRKLKLARPGGESGQHRGNGPATEEDIASEIWDQINS